MTTTKLPRALWAVLTAPATEAEAKAKYQAVTGREPARIHQGPNGWWFIGWLDRDEAAAWRQKQEAKA
ncbi:hypothetical protein KKH13_05240 [Patescibacteria group bacterium]|nr:hypothetical protein [Patescibacteria group bacterium]